MNWATRSSEPQHLDAVGHREDLRDVVADQDDGDALLADAADEVERVRVCTTPSAAVGSSMNTTLLAHVTARRTATP